MPQGKKFDGDLKDYKDKYLRCRGRRNHPWKFQSDFNIVTKGERIIEFTQVLHCSICKTDRKDTYEVTREGRFVRKGHPQYEYADGYQISRGNHVSLDDARDELLMRELGRSLDNELMNRLLAMRPDAREAQPRLRIVEAS